MQSIDLQLNDIAFNNSHHGDQVIALNQQREELEDWKRRILADPSSVPSAMARKRPASETDGAEDVEAEPAKKRTKVAKAKKRAPTLECKSCMGSFFAMRTVTLNCCNDRYCLPCFHEMFETNLRGKQVPRCCGAVIEPQAYSKRLSAETLQRYKDVAVELEDMKKLRCSSPACNVILQVCQYC